MARTRNQQQAQEDAAPAVGVPGAAYVPQEGDRTAAEKQKSLDAATKRAGSNEEGLSLVELNKDISQIRRAVADMVEIFQRSLNIDFLDSAHVQEVLSGEAAARAALSPFGESPQLVSDSVVPPGTNNPTAEITPPNVFEGETPKRIGGDGEPIDQPNK